MALKTTHPFALSRLLTEDLYRVAQETVGLPADSAEPVATSPVSFSYLGENNKYFLILVDQPGEEHIHKESLADLEKILKAMKLEVRDTAIVNLAGFPGADFQQLKDFFACSKVVLFGISP